MNYFNDISFVTYGITDWVENTACGRRFEGYYGIQYVFDGEIFAHVNENPVEIAEGPVVFITYPGVSFSYGSRPGMQRRQAHICFKGERVKRYLKSGLLQLRERDLFIRITANEPIMQAVRSLQKNLRIPGNSQHARAVLLLEELLLQLQEQSPGRVNSSSQYIRQLHSLREKIADTPYLPWDFEKEAEKLSVSYVHFRRIFRQVTGWSPGQYLLECRLRHAEKLLMTSHLRISEISNECGFEDEFHFSRIFKKHRAMSPSRLRALYGMQE